jgi:hypothetical protein
MLVQGFCNKILTILPDKGGEYSFNIILMDAELAQRIKARRSPRENGAYFAAAAMPHWPFGLAW